MDSCFIISKFEENQKKTFKLYTHDFHRSVTQPINWKPGLTYSPIYNVERFSISEFVPVIWTQEIREQREQTKKHFYSTSYFILFRIKNLLNWTILFSITIQFTHTTTDITTKKRREMM